MSKKYYSLILIPLLSACSWGGTPSDFSGMYTAHLDAQIESARSLSKDLGIGQSYAIDGSMKFGASMPGFMSGVLSTDYSSKVDGRNIEFTAKNLLVAYEALIASGSVSLESFGITSHAGDVYFLMNHLREYNMLSPAMLAVFQKYDNTWFSLTKKDLQDSLSGGTTQDILSYQLSENLSTLSIDEIKGYLVKYPLFQETKDLGMSGALHVYAVMLSTNNIVSLADTLSTRLTGSGMTPDARASMTKELSSLQNSGTISYDPKNPKYLALDLALTPPGGEVLNLSLIQESDTLSFSIRSAGMSLAFSTDKTEKNERNITLDLVEGGKDIAKLVSTLTFDGERMADMRLTLTSPAQGVTLTMYHQNMKDGSFAGDMNFGVGNMTWTGKVDDRTLAGFHVKGAMIGTSIALDLEPTKDDLLQGPLVVKSGEDPSISADIGLRLTPERFSLAVDMVIPGTEAESGSTDTTPKAHFDADIIAKRSDFSGKVTAPSSSKSFREFIDALDALAPAEGFTETPVPSVNDESGLEVHTTVSGSVQR